MNTASIKALEILVYNAIVAAGMVAENMQRKAAGHSMAHDESSFITLAESMRGQFNSVIQYANP